MPERYTLKDWIDNSLGPRRPRRKRSQMEGSTSEAPENSPAWWIRRRSSGQGRMAHFGERVGGGLLTVLAPIGYLAYAAAVRANRMISGEEPNIYVAKNENPGEDAALELRIKGEIEGARAQAVCKRLCRYAAQFYRETVDKDYYGHTDVKVKGPYCFPIEERAAEGFIRYEPLRPDRTRAWVKISANHADGDNGQEYILTIHKDTQLPENVIKKLESGLPRYIGAGLKRYLRRPDIANIRRIRNLAHRLDSAPLNS